MFPLGGPCGPGASPPPGWCSTLTTFANITLAATDGIVGQLILPRVLTVVKALATLAPAARGFGLDAGSAHAPQRAIVRRCRTPLTPTTKTISVPSALSAARPIVPRRPVIRSTSSNHNPNHTIARGADASERRHRWADRVPSKSRETIIRRKLCPERPPRNLRFRGAMGVPPSHPPRGSLPAGFFLPGRVRARRRRPPVGSPAPPTGHAFTPHERAARSSQVTDGIVGQRIIR